MKTCEDCGTKMNGNRCPNCHEELEIIDQYYEQGMELPPDDCDFMIKVKEQEKQIENRRNGRRF